MSWGWNVLLWYNLTNVVCLEEFWMWEFVPNGRAVDADVYSQQLEQVHENHDKNSGIGRNRTPATPSIKPSSSAFWLPFVSIYGPFIEWKKFRKHWSCGSGSLRIKNQILIRSRDINLAERWLKTIESDGLSTLNSSLICQKTFQIRSCLENITYETVSIYSKNFISIG